MLPIICGKMDLDSIMLSKIKARHSKTNNAFFCHMETKDLKAEKQLCVSGKKCVCVGGGFAGRGKLSRENEEQTRSVNTCVYF